MQLTGSHKGNEMRNATCVDTQISIEWRYCSFPILWSDCTHRVASMLFSRLSLSFYIKSCQRNRHLTLGRRFLCGFVSLVIVQVVVYSTIVHGIVYIHDICFGLVSRNEVILVSITTREFPPSLLALHREWL